MMILFTVKLFLTKDHRVRTGLGGFYTLVQEVSAKYTCIRDLCKGSFSIPTLVYGSITKFLDTDKLRAH